MYSHYEGIDEHFVARLQLLCSGQDLSNFQHFKATEDVYSDTSLIKH